MKFQTILRSNYGKLVISLILGFGLSTLFRKSCKDKECLKFEGPSLDKMKDQTYKHEDKCYQFNATSTVCTAKKRTVRFT
jgi:hypothetical protein